MEDVENVTVKRGNDWFASRRIRQMVIRGCGTLIRRIVFLGICRKGFFPLGTLHRIRHLSMHLLGDLTKKRGIALLRFGRWEFVGMRNDISMGAPIAGAINDLLVLGYGTSDCSYWSIKENLCHNFRDIKCVYASAKIVKNMDIEQKKMTKKCTFWCFEVFMGYSWNIYGIFMEYSYVSVMCRLCIGYVSELPIAKEV